jgi:hypothetical protein
MKSIPAIFAVVIFWARGADAGFVVAESCPAGYIEVGVTADGACPSGYADIGQSSDAAACPAGTSEIESVVESGDCTAGQTESVGVITGLSDERGTFAMTCGM